MIDRLMSMNGPSFSILLLSLFFFLAFVGLILYRLISYREGGRGYKRLEAQANTMAREVVNQTILAPVNASVNLAGSLVGAMDSLARIVSSLSELTVAMAICWDAAMHKMANGKYYEAAKLIADDPRISSYAPHRRLIRTVYLCACGHGSEDAAKIKDQFSYVVEDLEPFPVLPPFEVKPVAAPTNDARKA